MRSSTSKTIFAAALAAFFTCAMGPVLAQSAASGPDAMAQSASAAQPMTKAEQKKQAKAQRKADRKAARAKNTAELKTLEKNGYQPGADDPNYPQNIQNAEKKAHGAVGASQ
jgi:hypothetical protein